MKPLQPFDIDFSGINLVEASAGTGKTYNITALYIRALIELDLLVSQILVVTYTEAATKELKDRLLRRLSESIEVLKKSREPGEDSFLNDLLENTENHPQAIQRLESAVRTFDEAAVYTIHGFCYQVLQEQAFESRALYDAEMIGDDSDLVLEIIDDYWRNKVDELSTDVSKRPLLKFLNDKNCLPENLAKELSSHLGKPYLKILPEQFEFGNLDEVLQKFQSDFTEMKKIWSLDREELFDLLNQGILKRYGKKSLQKWFNRMDEFLALDVPPIKSFRPLTENQFSKFIQSEINNNLNKKAIEKGVNAPQHEFFQLADNFEKNVTLLRSYNSKFKKDLLLHLRKELSERKEELQVLSYDDLLLKLQEALKNESNGRQLAAKLNTKYPIALVDEFQDTDPAQYEIFSRIYEPFQQKSALFMIGDPKQSIYSFRGADVFAYLKARKDADSDKIFNLGYNFRSTSELISSLNTLFGGHENPFILGDIPFKEVKAGKDHKNNRLLENGKLNAPVHFHDLSADEDKPENKGTAEEKAAKHTASEIKRLIDGGKSTEISIGSEPLKAKDIAVLVQTHKQGGLISSALREKGIKSVQYSQESVFGSDEARQLQIVLKAVADPSNERFIKTALAVSLMKFTAVELLELEEDESRWLEVLERFANWHEQWQQKGFQSMFRSLLKEAEVYEHVIKNADGERRLTNLLHLGELLQAEDRRRKGGPRGLLKWLTLKQQEDTSQQEEAQLRLESDEELVKIVTMHRSKGLEYPVVFCPFLWKGPEFSDYGNGLVYHHKDSDQTFLDFNGKTDAERHKKRLIVEREALAEQMRLAYVAMTRAEHRCNLTWIYANKSEFSPLGYLFLGPERVFPLMQNAISGKKPKKIKPKEVSGVLQKIYQKHSELFSLNETPTSVEKRANVTVNGVPSEFTTRSFSRSDSLDPAYKISSFSSLTAANHDSYLPDYDQFIEQEEETSTRTEKTIFSFPKGAQAGTCIHKIFEDVDFGSLENSGILIRQSLESFSIGSEWEKVIAQMLKTTINKPLLSDTDLKLAALSKKDFIPELEFYYRSGALKAEKMLSFIRNETSPKDLITGDAEKGFMKGFIDLTFQFENKFYLLDYKSNFLGDSISDYSQDNLQHEMREKFYDLQYHIYTIALHRFFKKRWPGYSYEQNFGGAFYLFVRGINEKGREGIYFDRPDSALIQQLDEYILEGEKV